jgi:hypothetical protein
VTTVLERLGRLRGGRGDVVAHSPNDDWNLRPRYTDGVCPICGWRASGALQQPPPLLGRLDWFWPSVGFLAVVSIAMAVAVILAYVRA